MNFVFCYLTQERNNTLEAEISFMEQQRMELEERLLNEVNAKKQLAQETEVRNNLSTKCFTYL